MRTMFGLSPDKGVSVLLEHADWLFLDTLLASRPEWNNFIELGAYYGLTSLYLGIIAGLRHGAVHTFDNIDQRRREIVDMWPDCVHFCHEDLLKSTNGEAMRWLKMPYTFAVIDNGDKCAEANMYLKHLSHGSGAVIHNFGTEWTMRDVEYVVKEYGFASYLDDVAAGLGSSFRCFVRA